MSVIEIVIVIAAFTALLGAALFQNRERRESADYTAMESVLCGPRSCDIADGVE